ncbi:MAG: hypothetical protein M1354_01005 [Candidatus Marsarchaeota archaeon]|nr:hypothetical protein [Candidatus Marsarchaeota archaeon]
MIGKKSKAQSSFELLITLSVGLAILLPVVAIAFIQLANANSSLSSIGAQQAASKLAGIATLVGSEGPPAKQVVQLQIPTGVRYIYIGSTNNDIGHEVIFVVGAPAGLSYVTAYTPINISGNLGGIVASGSYLVNVTAVSSCPGNAQLPCVYISPIV